MNSFLCILVILLIIIILLVLGFYLNKKEHFQETKCKFLDSHKDISGTNIISGFNSCVNNDEQIQTSCFDFANNMMQDNQGNLKCGIGQFDHCEEINTLITSPVNYQTDKDFISYFNSIPKYLFYNLIT